MLCVLVVGSVTAWIPITPIQPQPHGVGSKRKTLSSPSELQMGLTSTVKRVRDSLLNKERSREDLKIGIAGFYDRSSKLWEEVWGEVRHVSERNVVVVWMESIGLQNDGLAGWPSIALYPLMLTLSFFFANLAHAPWLLRTRRPHRSRAGSD